MDPGSLRVILLAVVPDKLYIIEYLFDELVLIFLEFFVDGGEIHGMRDDLEIIGKAHAFPVNWFSEIEGLVGFEEAVDDYFYFF